MLRVLTWLLLFTAAASAAERRLDFGKTRENQFPEGFRSAVSGEGRPGDWKVLLETMPSALPAADVSAAPPAYRAVLAQLSTDPAEERFPLAILEGEVFDDFTFSARLKTVSGKTARMAGLAFRIQDERNYYVARISSTGTNVQFYKFVGGVRSMPIGPDIAVPTNVWHELKVVCKGNRINIFFNGKAAMPELTDSSFSKGKVGFWTKSDSVSHFTDAVISYTPRERFATALVRDAAREYSRLQDLKLYILPRGRTVPEVVAAKNAASVGQPGGADEKACLDEGTPFFGKTSESAIVLLPLRDRSGEIVGAVKVKVNTFFGQTEQNALARARPVVQFMERRVAVSNETLQ